MRRIYTGIILLLCLAVILGACGAPAAPAPPMPAAPAAPAPAAPAPAADASPAPARPQPTAPAEAAEPAPPPAAAEPGTAHGAIRFEVEDAAQEEPGGPYFVMPVIDPDEDDGRMLVYNVTLRLQTDEFMSGWRLMLNTVGDMGGRFPHAAFYGHDMRQANPDTRRATFDIRLPTRHLAQFIEIVEQNYNIWWLDITEQDEAVTYQRRDTAIQGLQDEEDWLLGQLEGELTTQQELDLLAGLAHIRGQIAELQISQDQLIDQVIYSTITVELLEAFPPYEMEEIAPPTFGERLGSAASESALVVLGAIQGLVVFIVESLPAILGLILIIVIAIRVTRRLRRNDKVTKFLSGEQSGDRDSGDS